MRKKLILGATLLSVILLAALLTGCNKQLLDTNYSFNRAKIIIGDEVIEVKVKSWNDYDDTSIQITDENGTVYLTDIKNVILINK